MNNLPNQVDLLSVHDGRTVVANVVKLTRELAQTHIDAKWWTSLGVPKETREKEKDYIWRWAQRIGELRNDRWHEAVAIQTNDNNVQGAILYWINTTSYVDRNRGAVYVEALATAPRNRPWLVASPVYRGVGDALLLRAVIHSFLLGLKGVVNLEAFDDERLRNWYQNRGFSIISYDDGLPHLELGEFEAASWLREEGLIDE